MEAEKGAAPDNGTARSDRLSYEESPKQDAVVSSGTHIIESELLATDITIQEGTDPDAAECWSH